MLPGRFAVYLLAALALLECQCASNRAKTIDERKPLNTALLKAAEDGNLGKVKELLGQGASVNTCGPHGLTPLHYAAYGGHMEMARLLISKGANVNAQSWSGKTPCFFATSPEMRDFLQECGGQ